MKRIIATMILLISTFFFSHATTLEYNALLGFNGLFRENSWVPLSIRLQNNGPSFRGTIHLLTDNSSTAREQYREYTRPVELSSGAEKIFNFVIPIGHRNRDIDFFIESDGQLLLDETVKLKQRGIRENFILGVSTYPDLEINPTHQVFDNRIISYPHPELLPDNPFAYDAVDILSIHRDLFDRTTNQQFDAISSWVNKGGLLVVWGGKSPAPEKREYLPCTIKGLTENRELGILTNRIEIDPQNELVFTSTSIKGAIKKRGEGYVLFLPFDYRSVIKNWTGLNEIWDKISQLSSKEISSFQESLDRPLLLENYIELFDNSGFTYFGRTNIALILFLSASVTISLIIFLRLRRDSKHINKYILLLLMFMLVIPLGSFFLIFNSSLRTDCFILDLNILYQKGISDKMTLYKDVLLGSSGKTESRITLMEMTEGVLKRNEREILQIEERPELVLNSIEMNPWSSKLFRFEDNLDSLCNVYQVIRKNDQFIIIENNSDVFLRDAFLTLEGEIHYLGGILPQTTKEVPLPLIRADHRFSSLKESMKDYYFSYIEDNKNIHFGAFATESLSPITLSNDKWRIKSSTLIINEVTSYESSF